MAVPRPDHMSELRRRGLARLGRADERASGGDQPRTAAATRKRRKRKQVAQTV